MANEPKTLLQMAGASNAPPALSDSTVVVIDAQREYTDGKLPLTNVQPALDEIGKLLEARSRLADSGDPHPASGQGGRRVRARHAGLRVRLAGEPRAGEAVVHKSLPNAFASTDLASRLAALKKPNVVLVGFMTHLCVEATARASIDLGFKATVVASATATRPLPDPLGGASLERRRSAAQCARGDRGPVRDGGEERGRAAGLIASFHAREPHPRIHHKGVRSASTGLPGQRLGIRHE